MERNRNKELSDTLKRSSRERGATLLEMSILIIAISLVTFSATQGAGYALRTVINDSTRSITGSTAFLFLAELR